MFEIKSLMPMSANSSLPMYSLDQHPRRSAPGTATPKRAYAQIALADEQIGSSIAQPLFVGANDLSGILDDQPIVGSSMTLHQTQVAAPESQASDADQALSQLASMRLKHCVKGRCYLPSPDIGSTLLNEYLADFNSKIPLFRPESIYTYVRDCYSGTADLTPLWFVLTYTAFGIAHRLRAAGVFAALDDTANADWYLNKCLGVLPDLLLQRPSLQLVQALIGVAILLQSSPKSRKASLFVSTAMHMAQDLGYNELDPGSDSKSVTDKQGFYVFWIAFVMDTTTSLRANRPNTQRLIDISVQLPSASSSDWWISKEPVNETEDWKLNVFALRASLALIQAEASEELFSVKARRRPAPVSATIFKEIIRKLEDWRRNNPLSEVDAAGMLSSMYRPDVLLLIELEAAYFETLYQVHAAYALGAFNRRLDVFVPEELKAAAERISPAIYADAQRLLSLAALVPQGNVSVTW